MVMNNVLNGSERPCQDVCFLQKKEPLEPN